MRFNLRPAVYEFLALLHVTLVSRESRTTRMAGLCVLLLWPFFALLALLANRPERGRGLHHEGAWERLWGVERDPDGASATGWPISGQ